MGAIYALVALGFHIIYNATGAINVAQGEQVILGGVIALTLLTLFGLPLPLVFIPTFLAGAAIGLAYERLAIRPLLSAGELSIIIASFGVAIIMRNGIALFWGKEPLPFPPFTGETPIDILGVKIVPQAFWVLGITFAAVILLNAFFNLTITGKAIQAAANNPTSARLMGISPVKVVSYSFGLSSLLGAVAGLIISPITFAGGTLGMMIAIKGYAAAVLGGMTSSAGAVLGGLTLGVLEFMVAGFISSGYRDAIALGVLLFMLVVRPEGLLGSRR